MRVLFVDDERQVLQGLRRLLFARRDRWQLSFATDGAEALRMLDADAFDVVVSDVRMPRMSGVELLAGVRDHHPGLIRILLSGQVDPEAAVRTPAVSHRFLSKPCDAEELIAVLEQAEQLTGLPGDVRELVAGASSLPSVPALRRQLEARLTDPQVTVEEIAAIVRADVAMGAKVLHLVSSSFLGPARLGADVGDAVAHIGLDRLRQLLGCTDIFSSADQEPSIEGFCLEAVSSVARSHAQATSAGRAAETTAAATAALLQDVGQLLLAARAPEQLSANLAECSRSGQPLEMVERRNDGFTHADIGAAVLALWGLPAAVVERVGAHHGTVSALSPSTASQPHNAGTTMEEVA